MMPVNGSDLASQPGFLEVNKKGRLTKGGWIYMATVMPEGERIRRAVKWISAQLTEHPEKSPQSFLNDAVMRFDLSPKEADFLLDFYRKAESGGESDS